MDAAAAFLNLATPLGRDDAGIFSAAPLSGKVRHRIGKDESGFPCLLVEVSQRQRTSERTPILIENLAVTFNLDCEVLMEGKPPQRIWLTVIRCTSHDPTIQKRFLELIPSLCSALGHSPDEGQVNRLVQDLLLLFRSLNARPRSEIQGLWGELFVLSRSSNLEVAAEAWQADPYNIYDFNAGEARVEVKTFSRLPRSHHFLLAQLRPPASTSLFVVSLQTSGAGGGESISDLIKIIQQRSVRKPEIGVRVMRVAHEILGETWRDAERVCFDSEAAFESIRFFDASVIPCLREEPPPYVTDIHFVSDLSSCGSLSRAELRRCALTAALVPVRRVT